MNGTNISKGSFISIGLVVVLLIGTFYLGVSYSNISTRMDFMEKKVNRIEIMLNDIHDKL